MLSYEAQRAQFSSAGHRVRSTGLRMMEASPSAYPSGLRALGTRSRTEEEEPSGASPPTSTTFTVGSTGMPAAWMSAS
jgi:hypothetical protein